MDRIELVEKLNIAKTCISENPVIAVLSYISFRNNVLAAFNGEQGAILKYDSGLDFAVKGKLITSLLDSFSEPDVDIRLATVSNLIIVECGKAKNNMAVESNTKFPYPLNDSPFNSLGVVTKDFINGLKKCIISVDKNSIKREYAGVTFIAKKDSEIVLYASKHNTVITKYITDMKSSVDCTMILPYFFCELLIKNFEEDVTELMFNDKIVKMSVNNDDKIFYTLYDSRLKILDFENEIANLKIASIKTFDVTDSVKNILKRCLIILDTEKDKKIKVSLSTDKMSINAISSLCNFDENVKLKGNTNNVDFTLNAGFMKETLDEADKFGIADEAFIGTNDKYTTLVAINY